MEVTLNLIQIYVIVLTVLFTWKVVLEIDFSRYKWGLEVLIFLIAYSVLFLAYNAKF
jgi:hypothetical protein